MELSTKVLLCCPCFGEIVAVEGLAEKRDSERTREKTHAFSRMSTSATQCAATLQGKRPLQKGTGVASVRRKTVRRATVRRETVRRATIRRVPFSPQGPVRRLTRKARTC